MSPSPSTSTAATDPTHKGSHATSSSSDPVHGQTTSDATRGNEDSHDNAADTPGEPHTTEPAADRTLSRLEALPAELRHQILRAMPDLATLRSTIAASPLLYAQFRHSRDTILRDCLAREMSGYLVDAYARLMSHPEQLGVRRPNNMVRAFLAKYRGWLSDEAKAMPHGDFAGVAPALVRKMAAFHLAVARPLARRAAEWALANLRAAAPVDPAAPGLYEDATALSRTEETRLLRAIYRCDTFHNLFGQNDALRVGGFDSDNDVNDLFFCIFEPWEAEAVGCVDLFVRDRYADVFDQVQYDTNRHHQEGIDLIDEREDYMDGTVERGLRVAAQILAANNHRQLVSAIKESVTTRSNMDASLEEALSIGAQFGRRLDSARFPEARDEAQERRDSMAFGGDAAADGPPLGWVLLWGGKYANLYGEHVPEGVRRWGYVLWDEARWRSTGAADLVARQWEGQAELVEEIQRYYGWNPMDPTGPTSASWHFQRLQ